MKKDFVEYLPYIVTALLVVSTIAVFARGGFKKPPTLSPTPIESVSTPSVSPTPASAIIPSNAPSATPAVAPSPTPTLTPTPTIPSIQGVRRRGDD